MEIVRRAIDAFVSTSYNPRTLSDDEFFEVFDPEITYDISVRARTRGFARPQRCDRNARAVGLPSGTV